MYKSITGVVAVLALAVAGAAIAHPTSSGSAQPTSSMAGHTQPPQHKQGFLDELKARLNITSAQEPAWNAFAEALNNMHSRKSFGMQHRSSSLDGTAVFDRMAAWTKERAERAQELANAADNLYGQLSAEQKAAWNETMQRMHAKKMRHHMDDSHGMKSSSGGGHG
ncbi:MAG: Spy/CpxP family protein refolding chaperone [Gammaproteobacteria bacterium]|nr:Spy/CpxP family protein refolding chaperone [Gammaproteobacteria bacterium]